MGRARTSRVLMVASIQAATSRASAISLWRSLLLLARGGMGMMGEGTVAQFLVGAGADVNMGDM